MPNKIADAPEVPKDCEAFKAAATTPPKESDATADADKALADQEAEAAAAKAAEKPEEKADTKVPPTEEKSEKADAPKKSAQERIAELSRRKGEAERASAADRAENEALKARIAALERGEFADLDEAESDDKGPKAPTPDDKNDDGTDKYVFGELDTKFVRDTARHEALETVREERARLEQTRQEQAAREAAEAQASVWADQLEAAAAETPDFVEKVIHGGKAGSWPCSKEVGALLMDSEVGAKVAYHLATNLREAVALDKITDPVERARSFGRLEATLMAGSKPKPAPARTSQADPPPNTNTRGTNGQVSSVPADFEAFKARVRKEQASG